MERLQTLIENMGTADWLIIGALVFLAAGTAPVKALVSKAWNSIPALKLPSLIQGSEPETVLDLIEKLEARRAGLAAELAKIDAMLGVKRSD